MEQHIRKLSIDRLGYNFIKPEYLPEGKDEYHLRNLQNRSGIDYRHLTAYEIEVLVRNGNTSDDWNKIFVSDAFNPELVKGCKFFGLVRIGKLEPYCLEFSDLKLPVGLYDSTIISCDFGDNVVINNVNYLSHYIIGSEVIVVNVNELATSDHAKFGNGILKDGEPESVRIWLEICNENGGRSVIPFNGMLPGDAWMWSKFRDDEKLLERFRVFTEEEFRKDRGFYGKIGDRTVIKNCAIIKDVWVGSDAYLKGANKLKNLTINSGPEGNSQIGEGCELVNGIIGFGCRIFYGVKAVRFIMASNSQLKYGARLINSYLGNNSTISCCEVLNSLIFPAHEQHHNNSFLCAALVMGQSNIPAGATIGSNHNSRAADGEIVAGRGFWPGLCVSLKHNSKFASFTILAKADYAYELNIPLPFSLVSLDTSKDELVVMPAYWFMYNMYALARNSWKYQDRDKRIQPMQELEYDYLAPDTVNEMFDAIALLEYYTGKAFYLKEGAGSSFNEQQCREKGKELLLNNDAVTGTLQIVAEGFENAKRRTVLRKVPQAYALFRKMIAYYGLLRLADWIEQRETTSIEALRQYVGENNKRTSWANVGGQLVRREELEELRQQIKNGAISSWNALHDGYAAIATRYPEDKIRHGITSLMEIKQLAASEISAELLDNLLDELMSMKGWINEKIYESRAKDYTNPFRKMIFDNEEEMEKVEGKLSENGFIQQEQTALVMYSKKVEELKKKLERASGKKVVEKTNA